MTNQNQIDQIITDFFFALSSGDAFKTLDLSALASDDIQGMIDALEDGEALAELGITDQDVVEDAHDYLNSQVQK